MRRVGGHDGRARRRARHRRHATATSTQVVAARSASAQDLLFRLAGVRCRACRRCASAATDIPLLARALRGGYRRSRRAPPAIDAATRSRALERARLAGERARAEATCSSARSPSPGAGRSSPSTSLRGWPQALRPRVQSLRAPRATCARRFATSSASGSRPRCKQAGGNRTKAAEILGLPRRTLVYKLSKLRIGDDQD